MRISTVAPITTLLLLFAIGPAHSQSVPNLNVKPVCRGIAQQALNPSETGGPDLTFAACVKNEQAMRAKLAGEWSAFSRSEKTNCIGEQMGGMASYTTSSAAWKWREKPGSSIAVSRQATLFCRPPALAEGARRAPRRAWPSWSDNRLLSPDS